MKKAVFRGTLIGILVISGLIVFAYSRTWGKLELEFRIHINEELVHESAFGESPTFAIWLEDPANGTIKTVYATRRAAEGDWEGKAEVPVALPMWFDLVQPQADHPGSFDSEGLKGTDALSGATPEPGYFILRRPVESGAALTIWMEVNLAGDYNESYKEFDEVLLKEDVYGSGQPALLYQAEIEITQGFENTPQVVGMTLLDPVEGPILSPLKGITTATDIFDHIVISVVRPKPRIIRK